MRLGDVEKRNIAQRNGEERVPFESIALSNPRSHRECRMKMAICMPNVERTFCC